MEVKMESTLTRADPDATTGMVAMSPLDIGQLAWSDVPKCPGVCVRALGRHGGVVVALIRSAFAATTPGEPHPTADHHIWIVSGSASIGGRRLVAGSYIHVPPGVAHPITATGPRGCTLLQVHTSTPDAGTAIWGAHPRA
jgi:quercetin dioxygenase-like cupin family protein